MTENLIFLHIRTSTKEASTSENLRSAFNLLAARIASATDIELLKKKEHSADNYSTIKNESEHDIAFKKFLDILHHDLFENKKTFTGKLYLIDLVPFDFRSQ
jgi:hypothetical protein